MDVNGFMKHEKHFYDRLHYVNSGKFKKAILSFCSLRRSTDIDHGTPDIYYFSFKHDTEEGDAWLLFSPIQFIGCVCDWTIDSKRGGLCLRGGAFHPTLRIIFRDTSLSGQQEIIIVDAKVKKHRSEKLERLKRIINEHFKVVSWELMATDELVDSRPNLYTISASYNGIMFHKNDDRSHVMYFSFVQNQFRFVHSPQESQMEITSRIDCNILATLKYCSYHAPQIYEVVTNYAALHYSGNESSCPSNGRITLVRSSNSASTIADFAENLPPPCLGRRENNLFVGIKENNDKIANFTAEGGSSDEDAHEDIGCVTSDIDSVHSGDTVVRKVYFTEFDLNDQSNSSEEVHFIKYQDSSSASKLTECEKITYLHGQLGGLNQEQTFEKTVDVGHNRSSDETSNDISKFSCSDVDSHLKMVRGNSELSNSAQETEEKQVIKSEVISRYYSFRKLMRTVHGRSCVGRPAACSMSYVHGAGSAQGSTDDHSPTALECNQTDSVYLGTATRNMPLLSALNLTTVAVCEQSPRSATLNRWSSETALTECVESVPGSLSRYRSLCCIHENSEMNSLCYATWSFHQPRQSTCGQDTRSDNNTVTQINRDRRIIDCDLQPTASDSSWNTSLCFTLQSILDRVPPPSPDTLRLTWRTYVHLRFALLDSSDLIEGWEGLASRIGLVMHDIGMIRHFTYHVQTTPLDIILRHWQTIYNSRAHHSMHCPPCTIDELSQIFREMQRNDLVLLMEQNQTITSSRLNNLNRICQF